jgi:8-oxo-dGTP diphosphatase
VARRINVVGAVIVQDGLVLCAQRGPTGALAGLWEFPGGKVEPGETARDALAREIAEELGCVVEVDDKVTTTTHEYDFGVVSLTTYWCRLVEGSPDVTEHAGITWLAPAELDTLEWAPADIPAVAVVRAQLGTLDTPG